MNKKIFLWISVHKFLIRQSVNTFIHFNGKKVLAKLFFTIGLILKNSSSTEIGTSLILKARRIDSNQDADKFIKNIIEADTSVFMKLLKQNYAISNESLSQRVLILKVPKLLDKKVIEKGAIVIKFTETFPMFYRSLNVKALANYFNIILEPSWVGYSVPEIIIWQSLAPIKVFIMCPYKDDYDFILSLQNNLIPLKLGPSDWVNPNTFYKMRKTQKIYDAIYVANNDPIKRVERYIKAVVRIRKKIPKYRAALVLAGHGNAKKEIMGVLRLYGDSARISYFTNMTQPQLNLIFNQSKVNLLVSLREGSNKGLAEGLFSGTPGLLISENAGGNHVHMNQFTGRTVPDKELENTMLWFYDNYQKFTPDSWVRENMEPSISAKKLSESIKPFELAEGRQWTTDLHAKVNTPELAYINSENDWLLQKRVDVLETFHLDRTPEELIEKMNSLTTGT